MSESLIKSVRSGTLLSYSRHWRKFAEWFNGKESVSKISPLLICEYLHQQFNSGYNTSTINLMRSAINFFTLNSLDLDNNILMKRLFKFFYNARPLKPRYTTFWPVSQLLDMLKNWYPIDTLNLRELTLKVIALIALSSSDRGQTLHLASLKNMVISDKKVDFVITDKVKSTRKFLKPTIISCISTNNEALDVSAHVKAYVEKTKNLRGSEEKLFISWKTFKSVTRQSLARWLTLVLKIAGIDTSIFKAHSYRGAGLSKAMNKSANISQIVAAGNWSSSATFNKFYHAPNVDSEVGQIILND